MRPTLPVLAVALVLEALACDARHRAPAAASRVEAPAAPSPADPTSPIEPHFPGDWTYPQGAGAPRAARAAAVTDAAQATRVAIRVLQGGGNAVDAAVAAAFALAVVFPTAGNIGGGGFLVARVAGTSYALDFRETAPAAASRTMYLGPDGKVTRDSRDGWRSVAVPGSVAGLWEAWHTLGSRKQTWPDLLAPAIALADEGFVVDAAFAKTVSLVRPRLAAFPGSAALFLPDDAPPAVGTRWRDPDLAAVLRAIARDGPAGFYQGRVADTLTRAMKQSGGFVTAADLLAYRAKWRTPLEYQYRGRHIVGMPPPSSGGVTMALIANLLSAWNLRALGWHSAEHIHLSAEAMRRAFAARNAKLGDPDFVHNPVEELMADSWARDQRATIHLDRATPSSEMLPNSAGADGGSHTTHLGVVDADGNAVALTTTLNAWFGSGVTVPGLGFVLNDEMDDFASAPGSANMFGLVQGEPNAIAPGKRMLSSMSPTIVLGPGGEPDVILGAAGGSRIITTVFEELSNVVDFGMSASDAVRAPRFHQQDLPDVLFLEPRGLPEDARLSLERMGHVLREVEHLADAPALGRSGALWTGAAEPRREGSLALGL
ncbi:MAG TPA: gamma-glutamyltransferase [Polyangiaceae bacterium]|nr:gamma-glutamyltransferase [Polyangiaceae bacterium]